MSGQRRGRPGRDAVGGRDGEGDRDGDSARDENGASGLVPYVVLLRGVNLGPHKRIAMADLRALLGGLDLTGVTTVLQSGNAVVHAPAQEPAGLAAQVERALADTLGLTSRCLVLTAGALQAVVDGDPFAGVADNGSRYQVIFLFDDVAPELRAEHDLQTLDPERIRVAGQAVYQWCPDGILAAPALPAFVERRWKVAATARNWNTVTKLAALVAASRASG